MSLPIPVTKMITFTTKDYDWNYENNRIRKPAKLYIVPLHAITNIVVDVEEYFDQNKINQEERIRVNGVWVDATLVEIEEILSGYLEHTLAAATFIKDHKKFIRDTEKLDI